MGAFCVAISGDLTQPDGSPAFPDVDLSPLLDVFENEPYTAEHPINRLDNVLLTPHALCWTDQCFAGIGAADVRAVLDVMHGRVPRGVVNREIIDDPAWQVKLDRYRERFEGAR